jgi:PKD repeat protein
MKNLLFGRLTFLMAAIFGLASVMTAPAGTTDVLLGFNDAAASTTAAQNDYVIDMGLPASALVAAASTNGGDYTFTNIISASIFSTAFSSDANALNDVAAGVVAGYTGGYPKTLFQTSAALSGLTTWTSANENSWAGSATYAQAPTVGEYASSGTAGWSQFVAVSPTVQGDNGGGNVAGDSGNPMELLSSGVVSEELFESTLPSGTHGTSPTTWTQVGTFNINVNTHNVTFILGSSSSAPAISSVTSITTNGFSPLRVVFTNTVTGSITNWVWNFGNGTIVTNTTDASVTNTYTTGGDYTVTLTVSGPGGSSTLTLANYVVASPSPKIVTAFANSHFVLSGTNCPAGLEYRLLSSTNLALPLTSWKPVFTNTFLSNGSFSYTNATTNATSFFQLISP